MSPAGTRAGPLLGTPYSIVASLGRGTTGEVFLATHDTLGKRVAIKLLRPEYARDPEVLERLRAEARLLARITHPALVGVYDLGVTVDGRTFFVMEHVDGPTLRQILADRRRLPVTEACALTAQILDGLGAAHAHGIVHRDVKPSNVLVSAEGRARIVDFGVAEAIDEERPPPGAENGARGSIVGTPPSYMAPEQVRGGRITPAADLYATACVLFELVTGSPPFVGSSEEVLRMHVAEPPPILSERTGGPVDAELESLLARALAKDPADRPRSAEAMAAELRRLWGDASGGDVSHRRAEEPVESRFRRSAPARSNVRELPTSFLGRTTELRELAEYFDGGGGLATLLGPAGCGKTRLAKRFAAVQSACYARAGGTWFCDLTEARDAGGAVACIARTLGATFQGGVDDTAIAQLGRAVAAEGPMLLVLDNCEQAARDVARLVTCLRETAPEAKMLATSRERLGVVGERVYDLTPLPLPAQGEDPMASEAVQLFVDRARLVRRDYVLGEDAPVVAAIVRSLDGIPLAIELAAARMRLMNADTLLERLDKRFELLADTGLAVRARQQTLRAAIDWSWRLLEPWGQVTLRQCAVFRGGFTLEAAEAVVDLAGVDGAPTVLEAVQRLRDKSLVNAQASREFPSELRLGLYESIREYAAEKLAEAGEADSVAQRHTDYFLRVGAQWAERAERGFVEYARKLEAEAENLTAVQEGALVRSSSDALRVAIILDAVVGRSGSIRARLEALERQTSRMRGHAPPALLAEVVRRSGWARIRTGAVEDARADAELALRLARRAKDLTQQGEAHRLRAAIERRLGGDALAHVDAALAKFRAVGDRAREARALQILGLAHLDAGDLERASEALLRAIALGDQAGDRQIAAKARGNLGLVLIQQGRLAEAQTALEESTAALRAMRDMQSYFVLLCDVGTVRQERGDFEGAERAHLELIASAAKTSVTARGLSRAMLGALRAACGETAEAQRLLDEAEAAIAPAGDRWVEVVRVHRGHVDLALSRDAAARGDRAASERHRADAERRLAERRLADGAAHAATDDLRTALRWLQNASQLESLERYPPSAWILAEDGAWFRKPHGWRVDVGEKQHAKATLRALVQAWQEEPGRPLTTEEVLRLAWPGERVLKRAGTNRVYVTISTLRDLGLRELILSVQGGYLLDPCQAIALAPHERIPAPA